MKLNGKVSIITGGGKGIGRVIALEFAREGSDVVICGRTDKPLNETAKEIRSFGGKCLPIVTDISKKSDVEAMVNKTIKEFSKIDVLICNASIGGPISPVVDLDEKDWDEVMAINLKGTFLCCQAALKQMIQRKTGRIITISSIGGRYAYTNRSPYSTSKLAIVALMRVLAAEAGPYNIYVNDICPGVTESERLDWVLKTRAQALGISPEEVAADFKKKSPLLKFVKAEEISKAAVFLASDDSTGITGVSLRVDVGFMITHHA